jgi:hypothetical protein
MQLQMLLILEPTPPEPEPAETGLARRRDPATSKRAARGFNPKGLCMLVYSLLLQNPRGLSIDELTRLTGREKVSVSPRLAQLRRKGFVRDSARRQLNAKRHEVIIWEAVV